MNTTDKHKCNDSLHTCGLKAFVATEHKKKEKLIREKTVIKK